VIENLPRHKKKSGQVPGLPYSFFKNTKPVGLSANVNAGFRYLDVKVGYFAILNPDIVFFCEAFSPLVEAIETIGLGLATPIVDNKAWMVEESSERSQVFLTCHFNSFVGEGVITGWRTCLRSVIRSGSARCSC
jgi:GT2 family glycosyltransferase